MITTGYTANITDETTFSEFAMRCSRAFLGYLREDSLEMPVATVEPSKHYLEMLHEAEAYQLKLERMSEADASTEITKSRKSFEAAIDELAAYIKNCRKLLTEVELWEPPTTTHNELKMFMRNQLSDVIKGNQHSLEQHNKTLSKLLENKHAVTDWLENQKISNAADIVYYQKQYNDDVKRVSTINSWIRELQGSLEEK